MQLLAFEIDTVLLEESLDQRNRPEGVDVLKGKVLDDLVVPEVALVLEVLSEFEIVVDPWIVFKLDGRLPLQARGQVCVVAEVEALFNEDLLDAVDVTDDLLVEHGVRLPALMEWNELDALD